MVSSLLSPLSAFEYGHTEKAPTLALRALKHAKHPEALPGHLKDGLILNDLDLSPAAMSASGSYQLTKEMGMNWISHILSTLWEVIMQNSGSSWVRICKGEDSVFMISNSPCLWFLHLSVLLCILLALLGCQQLLARIRRQGGQVPERMG